MITETEQKKIDQDYADYLVERDRLAAEGKAIGTFLAWQCKTGRNDIKITTKRGAKAAGD